MMEEDEETQRGGETEELRFSVFWPVLLLGVSLLMVLAWEIWIGADTRRSAQQLQDQQVRVVDQSKRVQQNLEKLVRGLVDLAQTDEEARKLVNKFGIKVTSPPAPAAGPSP